MKYFFVFGLLLSGSVYAVDCQEELDNYSAKNAGFKTVYNTAVDKIAFSDGDSVSAIMQKVKNAHMDRWYSLYELNVCYYETKQWRIEGKWPDQEIIEKVINEAERTPW